MVYKVAIFALIGLALYYFYRWLNGTGELTDVVLYTSAKDGLPANTTSVTSYSPANSSIPMMFEGGEYSFSTWIYITNWTVNAGYNKPFLTLGGGGGAVAASSFFTTVLYLGQNSPKIGIRTSTRDSDKLNTTEMTKIRPTPTSGNTSGFGVTPYTDVSSDFRLCDIEAVDLQRWVNITVVLSGRTQDIYIDGKMTRSCVLPAMFKVDGDKPTIILGGPYGFGGLIGTTRAANFAYSPDQVYKNYMNGPLDTSLWTKIMSYLDISQYSFSISKNGSNIASVST